MIEKVFKVNMHILMSDIWENTVNKRMCLSLLVVRKYAPIRWCALNREWNFGPAHYHHIRALKHKASSYELGNSWEQLSVIDHRSTIRSHRWQKTRKIAILFGETRFEIVVKSLTPSQQNVTILSIATLMQLAISKYHGLKNKY